MLKRLSSLVWRASSTSRGPAGPASEGRRDSHQISAGAVHDAKIHVNKPLKLLGVYVVTKTKPLASPAP